MILHNRINAVTDIHNFCMPVMCVHHVKFTWLRENKF